MWETFSYETQELVRYLIHRNKAFLESVNSVGVFGAEVKS